MASQAAIARTRGEMMTRSIVASQRRLVGVALLGALVAQVLGVVPALAYNPTTAAQQADAQALVGCNSAYGPCLGNDCTAFVSNVMAHAGFAMVNTGSNTHDLTAWWDKYISYAGWAYTDTWTDADYLHTFLKKRANGGTARGGTDWAQRAGTTRASTSGINKGDLLFFDWDSDGEMDHVTIQVGNGTDTVHNLTGDYADQHTGGERHQFWSKWSWNQNARTTTIWGTHIWPGN